MFVEGSGTPRSLTFNTMFYACVTFAQNNIGSYQNVYCILSNQAGHGGPPVATQSIPPTATTSQGK